MDLGLEVVRLVERCNVILSTVGLFRIIAAHKKPKQLLGERGRERGMEGGRKRERERERKGKRERGRGRERTGEL